jgi:seryl-tRNA(Sec) selenium transferase
LGQHKNKYIGRFFTGFSIIKDKVIKPLLVATERVVEYYFPEESNGKKAENCQSNRNSSDMATTAKDTASEDSELTKIKKRFNKLEIKSSEESSSITENNEMELPTLKKRRFRQLERYSISDDLDPFSQNNFPSKSTKSGTFTKASLKLS